MKQLVRALVMSASMIICNPVSAQNLLVNGGFEADGTCPTLFCTVTTMTGWTIGGNVDRLRPSWVTPFEGTTSLDLSGTVRGAVWQSVSGLTVGQRYLLSFAMSKNNAAVSTATMSIVWTAGAITAANWASLGATSTQQFSEPSTYANPMWSLRTLLLTATATDMQVMFRSENAGNGGPFLDATSLSVESTTVIPEPSTYLLMATGLCGIVVLARRRSRIN